MSVGRVKKLTADLRACNSSNHCEYEAGDAVDGGDDILGPAAVVQQQPADEQGENAVCNDLNHTGDEVELERRQHTADGQANHRRCQ